MDEIDPVTFWELNKFIQKVKPEEGAASKKKKRADSASSRKSKKGKH